MLTHLTIFRLSTRWGRRWTTCSSDECPDFAKIETAVDFAKKETAVDFAKKETAVDFAKIEAAVDFAKKETAVDFAKIENEDLQVDNLTTTNV